MYLVNYELGMSITGKIGLAAEIATKSSTNNFINHYNVINSYTTVWVVSRAICREQWSNSSGV